MFIDAHTFNNHTAYYITSYKHETDTEENTNIMITLRFSCT